MKVSFMPVLSSVLASIAATHCAFGVAQDTLPAPVRAEGFVGQRVGSGLLKWFGFEIYNAALWTPDGTFAGSYTAEPIVFTLDYRRSFKRDRLISITRTAWRELSLASAEQQERWSRQLAAIWVDVRSGSNLTTLVTPSGETRFYDGRRLLGRIDDPAFGPAFLSIWLDARVADTALGDLRADLLNRRQPH